MSKKILIVGGVAGGATAATRLRRLDENAHIIMFEKGEYISFANCGLPYYIGEVITDKDQLVVETPQKMKANFNIDVRTFNEVISIDREGKKVEVYDIKNDRKYSETYDKLVLAPGAEPIKPNLPGIDSPRIFTLRNIPDTYKIKDYVDQRKPKRAIVVGAGFIGLEVAENLHERGVKVTVVELADHVIGPLDFDMAALVHQHLKTKEVEFYLENAMSACLDQEDVSSVKLSGGKVLKADMVVLGIGVRPETTLAKGAGIELGTTGGILVDRHMLTNDENIYAVGDAVEVIDFTCKKPALIPLAGPANKQARIAANHIYGFEEEYNGTQGTSIVKVFDLTVAVTGNNERTLKRNNIEYEKTFIHPLHHAGYYPGAIPMSIKLIFGKRDGKILGVQIVGYDGVDKRIDVFSTAIRGGMTVHDLEELELAYAPPYSSAKDPVNIAGLTAANIVKGDAEVLHWDAVDGIDPQKDFILDVRTREEYELGTVKGAYNIPYAQLRQRLDEIPRDKKIYIFCQIGLRGYFAYRALKNLGYPFVSNLSGGYKTYSLATARQSNEDIYEYDSILKNDELRRVTPSPKSYKETTSINTCGLHCPGPIMKVYEAMDKLKKGEILKVSSTDPAFHNDLEAWCKRTGNQLLERSFSNNVFYAKVMKEEIPGEEPKIGNRNDKTMVVFSGDLDKAIASFIIATGAASMGRQVTMFFTFWGLNILRKPEGVKTEKDFLSRMFGFMMPRGSKKLKLSKMNMAGMGGRLIRHIMKKKNVSSLEDLIKTAQDYNIKLIACNMSMDVMGIKREELIDGVEIGGVASFLGSAEESDMSLFI